MENLAHSLRPVPPVDELPGWPPGRTWGLAKDVAAVLGCHRETVFRMHRAGLLRARPHGERSWRFHRDEVLRLVRSQAVGDVLDGPYGEYGEGPTPLERVLAQLEALTGPELLRVIQEAVRRALVRRQDVGRLVAGRAGNGR